MIVKRRKGKQAAEAWSLNWCEPLMAQTGDVNDLNDWLFLVTSTKDPKAQVYRGIKLVQTRYNLRRALNGQFRRSIPSAAAERIISVADLRRRPRRVLS